MPNPSMSKAFPLRIKRVYLPADKDDGRRILVDRLWPRGLSKAVAEIDDWMKEVAPSPGLRAWFEHDPARWVEFQRRCRAELTLNPAVPALAAHDEDHSHALVLADYLGGDGRISS